MRLRIVGCGDAFGSGGRRHTCFRLDAGGRCMLVDFGASAVHGLAQLSMRMSDVDAVVVTHLHGDHFGGLPFLLLARQFQDGAAARDLVILGPAGTRRRLLDALDILFPGTSALSWAFRWTVIETSPAEAVDVAGYRVTARLVAHASGAPSTGVRVEHGSAVFAYSGDTEWTDELPALAEGAGLFAVECSAARRAPPGHLDWPTLQMKLPLLGARRLMVTHLGPDALALVPEFERAGLLVAQDGLALTLGAAEP